MKTNSSESIIWRSNVALRLLISFFGTSREFYEKEVHEKTGISLGAVNKYMKLLERENLILLKKQGKMNFFKLNINNPIIRYLKITYSLSMPLVAYLKNIGKKYGIRMYLYGSVSRGEDDENSDWDILVIGNIKTSSLEADLSPLRKESRNEIKLTIFTEKEWLNLPQSDPAFYERLEKDKIGLI